MSPLPSDNSHLPLEEPALEAIEEEAPMPRTRVSDDSEMDITPMIDMTFLLLIFFLVCSQMDPSAAIQLPEARHGAAVATDNAIVFTVAGDQDEAIIYKGEGKEPANQLAGATPAEKESEIVAYVEEQVAANPSIHDVVIMAEAGVKHRDVSLVMKAISLAQTEGNQLHVAVMEAP